MRDFIRGTIGMLLQILLFFLGFFFFIAGAFTMGHSSGMASFLFFLGILSWCASYGIKYWMGHIARWR